jgi:ribosome-binding factor A
VTPVRKQKIEADIVRTLALLVLEGKVKDPRVQVMPSLHRAELSEDSASCKVFLTAYCTNNERKKLLAGLRSATPYFQTVLSKKLGLRMTPRLSFFWDTAMEDAFRVNQLIDDSKPKEPIPESLEE